MVVKKGRRVRQCQKANAERGKLRRKEQFPTTPFQVERFSTMAATMTPPIGTRMRVMRMGMTFRKISDH
ncbi:hypothetical protein CVU37_14385 [candidate division BRC1 bacterium HGW-BRC1-1]|nr:MAG: hypothetical protein CVU37_14385 [candidate division BRC1 bacterium HGW-BRC1-1]